MSQKPWRLSLVQLVCRVVPPAFAYRLRNLIFPVHQGTLNTGIYPITTLTGAHTMLPVNEYVGYLFVTQGYAEWRNWAVALAICSAGDTIVEVGAQYGLETSGFAAIARLRQAYVHTFEPFAQNAEGVRKILESNRLTNVNLHPVALGDRSGNVFFEAPPAENTGTGFVSDDRSLTGTEVKMITLDSLEGELGSVRLLVIDVEGFEIPVLRGAAELIEKTHPVIIVEAEEVNQKRAGYSLTRLRDQLTSMGYTVYRMNRFNLDLAEPDNPRKRNWNWIALHKSEPEATRNRIVRFILRSGLIPPVSPFNPLVIR